MKKSYIAWAVFPKNEDRADLRPFGNGKQFQYPLFYSRAEARSWRDEDPLNRGEIVRVRVFPDVGAAQRAHAKPQPAKDRSIKRQTKKKERPS